MMHRSIKIPILLFILLFVAQPGFSQIEISGKVLDIFSKTPLPSANIWIHKIHNGSSTNASGSFNITAETLPVRMKISYLGYLDTTLIIHNTNYQNLQILLVPDSVEIPSIVITASRIQQAKEEVPQRINVIDKGEINDYPANNTDDLLKSIPGINVNRSWGIFSRNASVTMRGMPGSSRSLILIDGAPLNKTAGGTVNWHLISTEEIERIEIVKGPGSSIYGNNAMGGVINIITSRPKNELEGYAGTGFGTKNTLHGQFSISDDQREQGKGIFWKLGSFYRQGDGYILEPDENRTAFSSKAFLKEGIGSALIGYGFGTNQKIELDYRFFQDKRGSGIKVFEKDGSYEQFTNNNLILSYQGILGRVNLNIKSFYFHEDYYRQNENLNSSAEYKLVDTKTSKNDIGLWITGSFSLGSAHEITSGVDFKHGTLDNHEIYRTSTDDVTTAGKQLFSAVFLQDVIDLKNKNLILNLGMRLDFARYYDGSLNVMNPTSKTGFIGDQKKSFEANTWMQFSPKVGLNYSASPSVRTFVNFARGFMPPRLDDLSGTRKIRRGFKIANPKLKPESLLNVEWGLDWDFRKKLSVRPGLFYSIGNDFQYLVATGEYIDADSEDPVPVYQRQNVSKVRVSGAEFGLAYQFRKNLKFNVSYTFNQSKILEYKKSNDLDLTGKVLNEVPENLVFAGISWSTKYFSFFANYTFTDEQWYDEENTEIIKGYSLVNLRISRQMFHHLLLSLDIQDLFDVQFIDRKGYRSPGRFIMFEIKYLINKNKNK